jgi:hypothetical protein
LLTPKELDTFFEKINSSIEKEKIMIICTSQGGYIVMYDKYDNDIGGFATNCNMKMLRTVELCTTMISDHMVPIYLENMARLIGRLEKKTFLTTTLAFKKVCSNRTRSRKAFL